MNILEEYYIYKIFQRDKHFNYLFSGIKNPTCDIIISVSGSNHITCFPISWPLNFKPLRGHIVP
jgi:hypothetical protein